MEKLGIIKDWVKEKSKILVLGSGDGEMLKILCNEKSICGFGIDISEEKVFQAISQGLSVIQGDINKDLSDYPKKSFDYVIAHDIIQIMSNPVKTLKECLEIGNRVIVSFPNFAYIKISLYLMLAGRMPKTKLLPYEWYNTPNIHLFTIKDFRELCAKEKIKIISERFSGFGKKEIPSFLFLMFFQSLLIF